MADGAEAAEASNNILGVSGELGALAGPVHFVGGADGASSRTRANLSKKGYSNHWDV